MIENANRLCVFCVWCGSWFEL